MNNYNSVGAYPDDDYPVDPNAREAIPYQQNYAEAPPDYMNSTRQRPERNYSAEQVRHFSKTTAVQFSLVKTRSDLDTLMIQHTSVTNRGGKKEGNWSSDSLYFQIEPDAELLNLVYFLKAKAGTAEAEELHFQFHGQNRNKSALFKKNPDGTLMVRINEGSKNYTTVLPFTTLVQLLTLTYKAYARRFELAVVDVVAVLNVAPPMPQPNRKPGM